MAEIFVCHETVEVFSCVGGLMYVFGNPVRVLNGLWRCDFYLL